MSEPRYRTAFYLSEEDRSDVQTALCMLHAVFSSTAGDTTLAHTKAKEFSRARIISLHHLFHAAHPTEKGQAK